MSSNLDNHKSSVRDIAKLFAEEKRLGTKAADLVNGTALTKCLEINEAFEVTQTVRPRAGRGPDGSWPRD